MTPTHLQTTRSRRHNHQHRARDDIQPSLPLMPPPTPPSSPHSKRNGRNHRFPGSASDIDRRIHKQETRKSARLADSSESTPRSYPTRLLYRDSNSGRICIFKPSGWVEYAIASHVWIPGQEITYKEVEENKIKEEKSGYKKLLRLAELSAQRNCKYFWFDTCCIDKDNPGEVKQEIEHMFEYYSQAACCFVLIDEIYEGDHDNMREKAKFIGTCQWNKRSWTLQEFLAPPEVLFYSEKGKSVRQYMCSLGTKSELKGVLSQYMLKKNSQVKVRVEFAKVLGQIDALKTVSAAVVEEWFQGRETSIKMTDRHPLYMSGILKRTKTV